MSLPILVACESCLAARSTGFSRMCYECGKPDMYQFSTPDGLLWVTTGQEREK